MLTDLAETTGHQQLLKRINRMKLVRHLCANPGLSRADLANAVGLTKSTVSGLVGELVDEGWLAEHDIIATGEPGRRPTPLFIDPSRLALLGAEVGVEGVRVVATALTGELIASTVAAQPAGDGAEARISALAAALLGLGKRVAHGNRRVIGIGVGLPGGVDEVTGTLHFAPNLDWHDVPVAALLRARLAGSTLAGTPLFVQNEADVAAVGELEFNADQASDPLLYVSIDHGVGAGVIVGDRLLTGSRGFAGEVGHVILQVDGPLCSCGRRGCAEALIGLRAMLRAPADAPLAATASPLAALKRRLADGDAATTRAVRQAGAWLGVLLQNLSAAYDPACIVLGGAGVELGETFLVPALSSLGDYAATADLPPPTIKTSHYGADAVAAGAAALARYRLTRPLIGAGTGAAAHAAPAARPA